MSTPSSSSNYLFDTSVLIEVLLDSTTADLYGDMRHDLAARGLLIPDNDTWIAATAVQYGLTLATRDAHFTRIAGLHAELW